MSGMEKIMKQAPVIHVQYMRLCVTFSLVISVNC